MKRFKTSTLSEEEKKKIGAIVKKKRLKKINVYFNKKSSSGDTKYLNGNFYSKKNKTEYYYRSSYELKCFLLLERDDNVISYVSEGFSLPYRDSKGINRTYIPDLLVLKKDGTVCVWEIKPKEMLKDADVQLKAAACKAYMEKTIDAVKLEYEFITEDKLFSSPSDYTSFVAAARKVKFDKKFCDD